MADGQHKLSRRAVLGGVCASSVLSRHPELVSGSSSPPPGSMTGWTLKQVQGDETAERCAVPDWDRALVRLRTAQAAVEAATGDPDQARYDSLADVATDALCALLALPAPDLPGLATKLDIILPHFAWELTGSESCLEILREDAHRLAVPAA